VSLNRIPDRGGEAKLSGNAKSNASEPLVKWIHGESRDRYAASLGSGNGLSRRPIGR